MARKPSHAERNWDSVLGAYLDVAHDADGTVRVSADYMVYADSAAGVYRARSMTGGTSYSHATDAGSVTQSAVTALGASGGTIMLAGNLAWGSVPALPKSVTGKLRIVGQNAKVTLSAAGPRLFDFNKVADHDTFQNIEISDMVVDVNNVGGRHHVVLGTYASGAITQRINIQDVAVRRVTTINVPVDPTTTNHRLNVYLAVRQAAASEGTRNTIRRVVVEDCKFFGGNVGVSIIASAAAGTTRGLNVLIEDNTISRCYHSLLSVQGSSFSSANYFIGSGAMGGTAVNRINDCYGEYSGDVGVEVDAVSAVVQGCTIVDSVNADYFHTSFNDPIGGPATHLVHFKSCVSVHNGNQTGRAFAVRMAGSPNSSALGQVIIEDCTAYRLNPTSFSPQWALLRDDQGATAPGTFNSYLRVERFTSICTGMAYSSGTAVGTSPWQIAAKGGAAINTVILKDVHNRLSGASTGGATLTIPPLELFGDNLDLLIDGFREDLTGFTGLGANGSRLIHFGQTAASIARTATLRNIGWVSVGDMTNGFGIHMGGTITIPAGQYIIVENCDFSKAGTLTAANAILMNASNTAKTVIRGTTWKTQPPPTTLTGLVTNTGKALGTGWSAIVMFTPGSGTAITALDYSTNGGTTYTNLLTQSSGALPASPTLIEVGPLPSDALIRCTFTGTQPTITLVPVNP